MVKKKKSKKESNNKKSKKDEGVLFAFLATFLSLIGFIIAILTKKDDKYVMFYAKQSIVIFIMAVIAGIIVAIVGWIPIIGWIIDLALTVIILVLWLFSWINSLSGKKKDIPVVEIWTKKIRL